MAGAFDLGGFPEFAPFDPDDRREPAPARAPPGGVTIHWHGEADPNADREWLIRDVISETGKGLLSGQWGTGKTFTALDLSASVISGTPFAGKRVMRRGGVLFVAAEGAFEIAVRLRGIVDGKLRASEIDPQATGGDLDVERLPFAWIEECPTLTQPGAAAKLVETVKVVADQLETEHGLPLVLVIVDTVATAAGFKDENSSAEAQIVMNALGEISRLTGAFVLGVDHFGKATDTGTRGSSAKEAAADTVLALLGKRDEAGNVSETRMAVRKVRGARSGYEIPYSLQTVEIGEARDGTPITTCFVKWTTEREARPTQKERWPTSLRVFRQALDDALASHGIRAWPYGAGEAEHRAAPIEKLRAAFYGMYPADAEDEAKRIEAKKKALQRAIRLATDRGLVGSIELHGVDHLWLKPE